VLFTLTLVFLLILLRCSYLLAADLQINEYKHAKTKGNH
jgi:hypothetical protein